MIHSINHLTEIEWLDNLCIYTAVNLFISKIHAGLVFRSFILQLFFTVTPVDNLHHYFFLAPVWLATHYNAAENVRNSRRRTRLGGTALDCKLPQSPWAPYLASPWSPVVCLSTLINIKGVRHINLHLTEQLQREKQLLAIRMEEILEAINRPEKKVNALLIICRTVGCAKGTVRIIRNNAEEIK